MHCLFRNESWKSYAHETRSVTGQGVANEAPALCTDFRGDPEWWGTSPCTVNLLMLSPPHPRASLPRAPKLLVLPLHMTPGLGL